MANLQSAQPQRREQILGNHRREATKRINKTLTENLDKQQQLRLRRIGLQQQGLFALGDPAVQEQLPLTEEQRQGFVNIVQNIQRQIQSLQQQNQGNPRRFQQQLMKFRREQLERIKGMLTEDQKRRWSELVGQPVNLDLQQTTQE